MRYLLLMTLVVPSLFAQDMKMLETDAVKQWPDNKQMQSFTLKNEVEAFQKLGAFQPGRIADKNSLIWLQEMAEKKWPRSYKMQVFVIEKELEAGEKLANFERPKLMTKAVFDRIFNNAAAKWEEWSMIHFTLTNQCDAWEGVRVYRLKGGNLINEALEKAEKEWPDDYSMQLYSLKKL
jgi:hypothetical protein